MSRHCSGCITVTRRLCTQLLPLTILLNTGKPPVNTVFK